jgi:hypothetical protein
MRDPIFFLGHVWTRKEPGPRNQYQCCYKGCRDLCKASSARCLLYIGDTDARVCRRHAPRLCMAKPQEIAALQINVQPQVAAVNAAVNAAIAVAAPAAAEAAVAAVPAAVPAVPVVPPATTAAAAAPSDGADAVVTPVANPLAPDPDFFASHSQRLRAPVQIDAFFPFPSSADSLVIEFEQSDAASATDAARAPSEPEELGGDFDNAASHPAAIVAAPAAIEPPLSNSPGNGPPDCVTAH